MEPAMMMGDRFEGHIVQGHVDCLGTVKSIKQNGNSTDFLFHFQVSFQNILFQRVVLQLMEFHLL